ncbi:MAG: AraC family transcriptional regulator [Clostridia bacterium]|nr:AraC family transcriptional regulator [Clostridia bacterium]
MKRYPRLDSYRITNDPLSDFLAAFHFQIEYYTNWPVQDHKTLRNIICPQCKLILLEQGSCRIETADASYTATPGCCIFVPPYTIYDAETYEGVNSYELFFNVLPIAMEQEFLEQADLQRITLFQELFQKEDFSLMAACYQALRKQSSGAYAQLNALLILLLIHIFQSRGTSFAPLPESHSKEQDLMRKLFIYLEKHLSEPIHVQQVCDELQISQSYLWRCCKNTMGISPSQTIMRYKLRYAQSLLKNQELSIAQVAEGIGMDPYYFSSQFKKQFFLSPSAYRKK